jgi:hypothetical protein
MTGQEAQRTARDNKILLPPAEKNKVLLPPAKENNKKNNDFKNESDIFNYGE